MRELAFLNKGVKITVNDLNQKKEKISTGNSILAFMDMKTNKPLRCPDYILEKLNI